VHVINFCLPIWWPTSEIETTKHSEDILLKVLEVQCFLLLNQSANQNHSSYLKNAKSEIYFSLLYLIANTDSLGYCRLGQNDAIPSSAYYTFS
jgi:hypothetical protein